jgi:hypothetical protein
MCLSVKEEMKVEMQVEEETKVEETKVKTNESYSRAAKI